MVRERDLSVMIGPHSRIYDRGMLREARGVPVEAGDEGDIKQEELLEHNHTKLTLERCVSKTDEEQ